MKVYRQQNFDVDGAKLGPGVYADYEFDPCTFSWPPFAFPRHPRDRPVVRRATLINCDLHGQRVNAFIAEECLIENLKTQALLWIHGAIFNHVVLRGAFGRLMFTEWFVGGGDEETEKRKAIFARADEAYYEHVDWALDIREAEFHECEFRYVPGHLVRRDPETQGLIWRDKLLQHDWNRADFPLSGWGVDLDLFIESKLSSVVIVAGKRHPKFKRQLEELKELRELGVVEPD